MKTVADYKVLCNDGTLDISNGAVAPCVNKGGIKPYFSGVKSYLSSVSSTPVVCKDGTTKMQLNDPNARVLDACRDNGGRAENQIAVALEPEKNQTENSVSDLQYYTSSDFLKRASISIVPVVLIGAYSYNKKFSLIKSVLLISIPIVSITGLQYVFMGGGKNAYWSIFVPPSARANSMKQLQVKK
jgi:hypothetical protein